MKPGTNVSFYWQRDKELRQYSQADGIFVTHIDMRRFLSELGIPSCNPDEWRLFIDISKRSLRSVHLHNGNLYGSIPIGHSVAVKENNEAVKKVLELIYYDDHKCRFEDGEFLAWTAKQLK